MTASDSPIAVFGATGAQGRPVVEQLAAAGRPVRAIARTPEKLRDLPPLAEPHPLDLDDRDALARALRGAAGAFVHLPLVPVEEILRAWAENVAAALLAANVPIAVFSTSGPVPPEASGAPTADSKRAALETLRRSGAPIVFLMPALYLGNLSAPFSAPSVVERGELRYPPFPPEMAMPWVSVEDQGALAIAALERPDLIGRTLPIGRRLTGAQLAAGIGEALERPVVAAPMTPDELGDAVRPMLGAEVAGAIAAEYRVQLERPEAFGIGADTDASHRELGVEPATVAEWARAQDWDAAVPVAA